MPGPAAGVIGKAAATSVKQLENHYFGGLAPEAAASLAKKLW